MLNVELLDCLFGGGVLEVLMFGLVHSVFCCKIVRLPKNVQLASFVRRNPRPFFSFFFFPFVRAIICFFLSSSDMESPDLVEVELKEEEDSVVLEGVDSPVPPNPGTPEIFPDQQFWRLDPKEAFLPKIKKKSELRKLEEENGDTFLFYKNQNDLIKDFLEVENKGIAESDEEDNSLWIKIAIYGSLLTNIGLLMIKIVAYLDSGSLSILASVLDSALDLLSGAVVFATSIIQEKRDPYNYPAGKGRIEPLGVIIFATAMFVATFNLVIESVRTIIVGGSAPFVSESTLLIIGTTVLSKTILFVYCYLLKEMSTSADALATDHRNDVVSNTFGLAFAILGQDIHWVLDPIGALLIACYLMRNWWITGAEQVVILSGKAADPPFLSLLTLICWNHHPKIRLIDTVKAYYFADGFLVQVDIVLDPEMTVRESHDIGESLQKKIEQLPQVNRCFVHIDYECDHKPEHY